MKITMRLLSLVLAVVMLLPALIACGKGNDDTNVTTTTAVQGGDTVTEPVVTTEAIPQLEIPEGVKYPGYTFNIASDMEHETKYTTNSIFLHEQTGELLEDAIYTRTVEVEELLGIELKTTDANYNQFIRSVTAGDNEFDLNFVTLSNVMTVVNKGAALDMYSIETIDLDKPWWDKNAENKLAFNNHLFYTFSDMIIMGMDNSRATFFNKDMIKDLNLEDPFQLVKDGKWTYDKMAEMGKQAVSDLDGNGAYTDNDRFGIVNGATTFYEALFTGCKAEIMQQGDDGNPYFFVLDEQNKFVDVYQTLLRTFKADNILYLPGSAETMFVSGHCLFYISTISAAYRMRQEDIDLGIITVPKWDVEQKEYLHVSPNGHAMVVPTNAGDTDRTGVILETLSYYSSRYRSDTAMMPAYFELAITARSSRDAESAEMLQIIHDSVSYVIKLCGTTFSDMIFSYMNIGKDDIVSLLNKQEEKQRKLLADTLDSLP